MNTVFIADDELIIRQGLKCIIDWESLGFSIIGEASNGIDALDYIVREQPDLVLIDIRMPGLLGVDVVKQARDKGFEGHFIILSGFTDFKYAQAAIRYGVDFYLTKPIDEDELLEAVESLKTTLEEQSRQSGTWQHYRQKAHGMILLDILTDKADFDQINIDDMHLNADQYQVVIYEKYSHNATQMSYRFADLLKVTNEMNSSYEQITIDDNEILLLKGEFTLHKFQQFLEHYEREQKPQKDSPLDSCSSPTADRSGISVRFLFPIRKRFVCCSAAFSASTASTRSAMTSFQSRMKSISSSLLRRCYSPIVNH